MINYLSYAIVGAVIVLVIEASIWMNTCLGLSMKFKEADFTKIMIRAPYRVFWTPKLLAAIVNVGLFTVVARYYQFGGRDLALAISYFLVLILFGALAFWESARAVRRYEAEDRDM